MIEEQQKLSETSVEMPAAVVSEEKSAKAAAKTKGKGKKKKGVKQVSVGCVHIKATYNNTIVTFTDMNGNVLSWSSAGSNGFKGPKKSTPYAASVIVRDAAEKVKAYGLTDIAVFVRGVGSGREGALRALNTMGFNVLTMKDVTPIPHNGCRSKKVRRV